MLRLGGTRGQNETILFKGSAGGGRFQVIEESLSGDFIPGGIDQNGGLLNRRILICTNLPTLPGFQGGRNGKRDCWHFRLRAAELHKLRGLGDVFAKDQLGLEQIVESCASQGGDCSATVGGTGRIGDGDFLNPRVKQKLESSRRIKL